MNYREPLPSGCPPNEAGNITAPLDVFRLVSNDPPTENDFRSQRAQNPKQKFSGIGECQALGLSVFTERRDLEKVLNLPKFRHHFICRLRLGQGAGSIQKTSNKSHHTWWPLADYEILTQCRVEAP